MQRRTTKQALRRRAMNAYMALIVLSVLMAIASAPMAVHSASVSVGPLDGDHVAVRARNLAKYDGRQDAGAGIRVLRRHEGHHIDEEDEGEEGNSGLHATEILPTSSSVEAQQSASLASIAATSSPVSSGAPEAHADLLAHHEAMSSSLPPHPSIHAHPHSSMSHSHGQDGAHSSHHHMHAPHPYDGVPEASIAGPSFITVPPLPAGAGGHNHGHGNEEPAMNLNETTILRGKGPDPLSYIEWDFGYGIGKPDELVRFANAYNGDFHNVMGVAGGRWRTLLDESMNATRKDVAQDIQRRVEESSEDPGRHPVLMAIHIIGCIVSCFILLPLTLALRAANSSLAPAASLAYLSTLAASLALAWLYKMMTPQLYPKHSHSGLGYAIFWLSLLALGGDVVRLLGQFWRVVRSTKSSSASHRLSTALRALATNKTTDHGGLYEPEEEEHMLSEDGSGASDAQELHSPQPVRPLSRHGSSDSSPPRSVHFEEDEHHKLLEHEMHRQQHATHASRTAFNEQVVSSWRDQARGRSRDQIPSPTSTLCNTPRASVMGELPMEGQRASWKLSDDEKDSAGWPNVPGIGKTRQSQIAQKQRRPLQTLRSILRYSHVTVARSLPVLSFAAAYTGLTVYTGSCRGPYKNVCLAHGIKGGVFFWYGLLTFGRYMGAYADMGWAWNRRPGRKGGKNVVSAEWVECLVILIYGSTNTWMERFGAKAGDPYTVKQVQHISIAVMFWFAGLLGLFLETPSLKNLLSVPVAIKHYGSARRPRSSRLQSRQGVPSADALVEDLTPPPSYSFSFNPFPALVIGVTGVAMAAHHQDYVYEVSIHALWGNLLAGFSALRMFTYFLLWLRPPTNSIMPSRPPTEALASFSLACGGFVFMLSSEEVSFVAMRNGFGDFMMILNVTVALVSLLFCWIAVLMVIKAWAVRRESRRLLAPQMEDGINRLDGMAHRTADVQVALDTPSDAHNKRPDVLPQRQGSGDIDGTVFVLDDEVDLERQQDEKRQFSSSPLHL